MTNWYYQDICNEEIVPNIVTNLLFRNTLYQVVIDNALFMQIVSCVWLRTRRCQWKCRSILHVFFQIIFMWKTHLNSIMYHSYLSSIGRSEPVSVSKDFHFVLCEIDISQKPFTLLWLSLRFTSFVEALCSFRLFFGISTKPY